MLRWNIPAVPVLVELNISHHPTLGAYLLPDPVCNWDPLPGRHSSLGCPDLHRLGLALF